MSVSLNAPVPPSVRRLVDELHPLLVPFDRVRERHTLVVKRLGDGPFEPLADRARRTLRGAPACEARVTGIDTFENPPAGPGPVVYLAVESPGLRRIHQQLCEAFDPSMGIEGDDYTPHVTLARGNPEAAARLRERDLEPVTWTVSGLEFYDSTRGEVVRRVSLPA